MRMIALIAVAAIVARAGPAIATEEWPAGARPVYLVSHGWHVGLVLRRADVERAAWPERDTLGPVRYLEVGWGDGDYYPARRGTLPLALRAAVRSRGSVLKVVGFDGAVAETFPRSKVLRVDLSPAGMRALAAYIHGTYAEDRRGDPVIVAPADYGYGFFFAARGHYGVTENSNTWAARALEVAGCPMDVGAALTAGALLHQAVRFATVIRGGALLRPSIGDAQQCGKAVL